MKSDKRVIPHELIEEDSHEAQTTRKLSERSELLSNSTFYPSQLLQLKDAPKKLYVLGDITTLQNPAIAIVGSRKATSYGLECARRFARKAASKGVTVVSGGAIGCDMAAHQGALDGGGDTVVVLGSGANVVYPLRARELFKEILSCDGALLSEAPWDAPPLSWAFSKRNRIIAALAKATLIVEAGLPSGTFQTADHTLALGNEVLVVPGPIFSKTSKGSNRLLAQGALPIVDDESFEDALLHIYGPCTTNAWEAGSKDTNKDTKGASTDGKKREEIRVSKLPEEDSVANNENVSVDSAEGNIRHLTERIMSDLGANPMTIDALAQAHNENTVEIIRIVSKLEVLGEIERLRDGRYITKL